MFNFEYLIFTNISKERNVLPKLTIKISLNIIFNLLFMSRIYMILYLVMILIIYNVDRNF